MNAGHWPSWEPVPHPEMQVQLLPLQGYLSVYGLRDAYPYLVVPLSVLLAYILK